MESLIFHIDVNSAFLSWTSLERLENGDTLDLRTIPSAIGGDRESRHGIVLAKSVPAKVFGVKTGEPIAQALRKCESLVLAKPDHEMYRRRSREMMELLRTFTPDLEQLSIDECFLDFAPIAHRYASAEEAAHIIADTIHQKLGFTVNIGIAPNKLLAKMASDFEKPNKVHTLYKEEIPTKMWPLPIEDLYMVGKSSSTRLRALGITTIGELAHTPQDFLVREFKSHGTLMWEYANGIAPDKVCSEVSKAKGIGNSTTLSADVTNAADAKQILLALSEQVAARLRDAGQLANSVTVEIKYHTFQSTSHQCALLSPTNVTNVIYDVSCRLFDEMWNKTPVRLLGIRTTKLIDEDEPVQMNLFDMDFSVPPTADTASALSSEKQQRLDAALDSIKNRFGESAVVRGSFLPPKED